MFEPRVSFPGRLIPGWLITGILMIGFILTGSFVRVEAAFPLDLDKKPLTARALKEDVEVYSDPEMTNKRMEVSGGSFVFKATDVSMDQKALFGSYEIGGEKKEGWVPSSAFLYDDSFTPVYGTVRAAMTIYTDSSLSEQKASIKKYSGIIAVGKTDGARQVIYESKKGYGIGWMSADEYENKLVYDGRDKQVLADGTYTFFPVYGTEEADPDNRKRISYGLEYAAKKMYRITDPSDGTYMSLRAEGMEDEDSSNDEKPSWMEEGIMHTVKILLSSSYREKMKAWEEEQEKIQQEKEDLAQKIASGEVIEIPEDELRYSVIWTEDKEEAGLFRIERKDNYFRILSQGGKLLYGSREEDGQQTPVLVLNKENDESETSDTGSDGKTVLWKVRAEAPMTDSKHPMVFTQYDPAWCGRPYGSEGCMGTAGCGILATVNAVYALTGQYMDVTALADYAVDTGLRIVGSGTDDGIFKAAAEKYGQIYGFEYDGKSGSIDKLKKKLKQGDVAMVHVIGHYVAVTAYDEKKDRYLLLDSNCLPKRETSPFGDWISPARLMDGYLYGQMYFFYRLSSD